MGEAERMQAVLRRLGAPTEAIEACASGRPSQPALIAAFETLIERVEALEKVVAEIK